MEKKRITVSNELLQGISSGMRSCFVVDESQDYFVNSEVEIVPQLLTDEPNAIQGLLCNINSISPADSEVGLKKNYTLLCVSVIRLL